MRQCIADSASVNHSRARDASGSGKVGPVLALLLVAALAVLTLAVATRLQLAR